MGSGYRRKRWRLLVFLCCVLFTITVIALYEYGKLREIRKKALELECQLQSYRRVVYVAAEKLPKGTILTKDKLWQEIRYSDYPQEAFITEESFGMTVAQDVAEDTCLTKEMVYYEAGNVREVFLEIVEIPVHIQSGDRVDVRIRYYNAEDYIVLSNKVLVKYEAGKGMVLELTEEEILLLSSAVSDSGRYKNTKLYVVEYPEYKQVETSIANYIATMEILVQLGREKTEGESRKALERRLLQEQ